MLAVELEVMAVTFGKFGWGRDPENEIERRVILAWAENLCDYPIAEVQDACSEYVKSGAKTMPTYGHILDLINRAREVSVRAFKARLPLPQEPTSKVSEAELERRRALVAELTGKAVKNMGGQDNG
jgi:hypothetical protein